MCTANLIGCMDRYLLTDLIQQIVTVTLNHPFIDSIIHSFIHQRFIIVSSLVHTGPFWLHGLFPLH